MKYNFDYTKYIEVLTSLFLELQTYQKIDEKKLAQVVKKYPKDSSGSVFSKDELFMGYQKLAGTNGIKHLNKTILDAIKMKPMRTQSGVAPITVLTKPFPCPGTCIFCPNDIRMPKSYLADEPGAQRAERNWFDPYLQTYNRLQALKNIGHDVSKAEIIVLGGTWSYYTEAYQIWFIKECFRALNDFGHKDDRAEIEETYRQLNENLKSQNFDVMTSDRAQNKLDFAKFNIDGENIEKSYNKTVNELYVFKEKQAGFDKYQTASWEELKIEQIKNENADVRSVGLVVETRPDNISEREVMRIRKLGCTKTQIGFQSLQDEVLKLNKRGHNVEATRKAVKLLRQAGFKIHAHWMANLYGSSVEKDKEDYLKLFADPDFCPDELKIYPCSLIGSAELMQYYKKGLWKPYQYEELLDVLSFCLLNTPEYCRLTRVIRDIPSTDIVEGNKLTNFRQIAEQKIAKAGEASKDIRAREIRSEKFDPSEVYLDIQEYQTAVSKELFLQYVVDIKNQKKILAFLRLSLPTVENYIDELKNSAIIREIHVYGNLVNIGDKKTDEAQHLGFGKKLIEQATKIAQEKSFKNLAVISAIGTKEYYRKRGFVDGELYQHLSIS